jgi:hypothetical protein
MVNLPKATEQQFLSEIQRFEAENQMPYITSVERLARQEGIIQKGREVILEVLEVRFGEVPPQIVQKVNFIEDPATLKTLHREAIAIGAIEQFAEYLETMG